MAAAIQRGDEPPGIRVVEDRLSADAPSLEVSSQQPSPPKPWEVLAGSAATTGVRPSPASQEGGGAEGGGGGYGGREEGRSRPQQHAVSVGP